MSGFTRDSAHLNQGINDEAFFLASSNDAIDCTVGPPVASLIVMTAAYLPYCAVLNEPIDVRCFVVAFIVFAVPLGYAFGVVPALLAGVMYCGGLTAIATLRPGMLLRACLGAISGGLVGGVWFHAVIGPDSAASAKKAIEPGTNVT
jgi:hypothetical protein